MTVLADFAENKLVDAILRGQPLGAPTTLYLALSTAPRSDAGAPAEPTGNGYARVAVPAALTSFSGTQGISSAEPSTGTDGMVENLIDIAWPESTGAWGDLLSAWIMDAATGGNAWISIDLTSPVNVTAAGYTVRFAAGNLQFQIDN